MKIKIIDTTEASPDMWDSIWNNCEYATYFHSREWADIWRVYSGGRISPSPKLVKFSDGKEALLPLSSKPVLRGLAKTYVSSPGGTYGGWISKDTLEPEHAAILTDTMLKLGNIEWRLNPFDELVSDCRIKSTVMDETHVLDLTEGFDGIFGRGTKGHRSAANKAQREGVSARLAATGDDWREHFEIYTDSLRRWKDRTSSKYDERLFINMQRRNSPYIRLWLAVFEGKVISGAICFHSKRHIVYWHGASLEKYFSLRATNLLMYEIIREAAEQGYTWFDFNPSGGHEGVKTFKKSFGASPLKCPVVTVETLPVRLVRKMKLKGR